MPNDVDTARQKLDALSSNGRAAPSPRISSPRTERSSAANRPSALPKVVDLTGDEDDSQQEKHRPSEGLRVKSKTTFVHKASTMQQHHSAVFPGPGRVLASTKGTPFLPADPESKARSRQSTSSALPSSTYRPGWNNGFSNSGESSRTSNSWSQRDQPVAKATQHTSQPSFKRTARLYNDGDQRSSSATSSGKIVNNMNVKGAGAKRLKGPEAAIILDEDGEEESNLSAGKSSSRPDFEELGAVSAAKARESARPKARRSLFGGAMSDVQSQDKGKRKSMSKTQYPVDDDIQDPDDSFRTASSSKRPQSSESDPLNTLPMPLRGKPPRASSNVDISARAHAIVKENCSSDKQKQRKASETGQGTLDTWHATLAGSMGTDDYARSPAPLVHKMTEMPVRPLCFAGHQFLTGLHEGSSIQCVVDARSTAASHVLSFRTGESKEATLQLKYRKHFDSVKVPDPTSNLAWAILVLTTAGEANMRHVLQSDPLPLEDSALNGFVGKNDLMLVFESVAERKNFAEFCSTQWANDKFKITRISGRGGQHLQESFDTALAQFLSRSDALRNQPVHLTIKNGAMSKSQSTSAGRQTTLLDDIRQKKRDRTSMNSTKLEDSDLEETSSVRRSGRRRREPKRSLTPIEIDPIPADQLVLVWPHEGGPGSVSILHGDRKRLADGEFLNDTLIDYGLKRILSSVRDRDPLLVEKVHLFNSFFYKKLSAPKSRRESNTDAYATVRKWTSKIKFFEKDYVIVPINENLHWYLAIVVNPKAILQPPSPDKDSPARNTRATAASNPGTPLETRSRYFPAQEEPPAASDTAADSNVMLLPSTADEMSQVCEEQASTSSLASEEVSRQLIPSVKDADTVSVPESSSDSEGEVTVDQQAKETVAPTNVTDETNDVKMTDAQGETEVWGILSDTDEDSRPQNEKCYILTFDSLGGSHGAVHKKLKAYLVSEAVDKLDLAVEQVSIENAVAIAVDVPTQDNFSDCGLYLLHFVETFLANPGELLHAATTGKRKGEKDAERRARIAKVWSDDVARQRRKVMRDDVNNLSLAWEAYRKQQETLNGASGSEKPKKKRPRLSEGGSLAGTDTEKSPAAPLLPVKQRSRLKRALPQSITIDDSEDEYTTDVGDKSDELPELVKRPHKKLEDPTVTGDSNVNTSPAARPIAKPVVEITQHDALENERSSKRSDPVVTIEDD